VASYPLSGKVVFVTGAGRGIGFETARQMHARGASVAIVDIDAQMAMESAAQIGERAIGIDADVRDREQIENAVAATVERFGGIDVAVANAGIAPKRATTARTVAVEDWERIIDVNLLGVWRTARAALPQIVERRGQLVLVASVYAFFNGVMNSAYATAKAGVEALGRSLRAELAVHGASATVAYFGFIDTKMVQDAFTDPLSHRFEGRLPAFMSRRLGPDAAGAAIVRGVEKRAPRVIAPRWWAVGSVLRGALNPLLDRRMEGDDELHSILREVEDRAVIEPERREPTQARVSSSSRKTNDS
jgi:NAD(P)-dependent dehydrogenase (short-subunit alcohol dehydrogenase family)